MLRGSLPRVLIVCVLLITGTEASFGAAERSDRRFFQISRWPLLSGAARNGRFQGDTIRPAPIIVNTRERRLYLVQPGGKRFATASASAASVSPGPASPRCPTRSEWPEWTPPPQMLRRRPDLPRHMKGGIDNPLGARAMYLGSSLYRIHGSNEPETIGTATSSGCFRMTNDDVIDLYDRVPVGSEGGRAAD